MQICPKCNKIMEDEAKFCSECASALMPVTEQTEEIDEDSEEFQTKAEEVTEEETEVAEPEQTVPEENPVPAPAKGRSRMGMFLCMLLAMGAVILMYVFYGELGFETQTKKTSKTVVFYGQEGQIYCTDLADINHAVTKDYPAEMPKYDLSYSSFIYKAGTSLNFKASSDGKTVFFPDKEYNSEDGSYSLYCMSLGDENSRRKIANRVICYDITPDGKAVYYLTSEGKLYRDDFETKSELGKEIRYFKVSQTEDRVVYMCGKVLYTSDNGEKAVKLASSVDAVMSGDEVQSVYYLIDKTLYFDDFESKSKVTEEAAEVLTEAEGHVIFRDNKARLCLAKKETVSILDCEENASGFVFAKDYSAIYYADGKTVYSGELVLSQDRSACDIYRIDVSSGKTERTAFDVSLFTLSSMGVLCYKDGNELYLNDTYLGIDVGVIAVTEGKIAFTADCDDSGNGTLTVYDGKKNAVIAQDAVGCYYTSKGELVYLADVAKESGKGELFRYTNEGSVSVADGVTGLWIAK